MLEVVIMDIIVSFLNSEESFQYLIIIYDVGCRVFKDVSIRLRKFPSVPVPMVASQNLAAKNDHLLCSKILRVKNLYKG